MPAVHEWHPNSVVAHAHGRFAWVVFGVRLWQRGAWQAVSCAHEVTSQHNCSCVLPLPPEDARRPRTGPQGASCTLQLRWVAVRRWLWGVVFLAGGERRWLYRRCCHQGTRKGGWLPPTTHPAACQRRSGYAVYVLLGCVLRPPGSCCELACDSRCEFMELAWVGMVARAVEGCAPLLHVSVLKLNRAVHPCVCVVRVYTLSCWVLLAWCHVRHCVQPEVLLCHVTCARHRLFSAARRCHHRHHVCFWHHIHHRVAPPTCCWFASSHIQ